MAGEAAPSLSSFVDEKSWLIFNIMEANGQWLSIGVPEWKNDAEFMFMYKCIHDLKVNNDCAEY